MSKNLSNNKMGLGKRNGLELGSGVVRYTRSMSGKRVAIFGNAEVDFLEETAKQFNEKLTIGSEKTQLEDLPQDVLVKVLCGVDHDDLKQLFHVSKLVREATIIAKKWHFEFSTPTKKIVSTRNVMDVEISENAEEIDAPDAPNQLRVPRSRITRKNLGNIKVALFTSPDD